jgi:hypothetical protein
LNATKNIYAFLFVLVCFLLNGCAYEGNCSNVPQRPTPSPTPAPTLSAGPEDGKTDSSAEEHQKTLSDETRGPQVQVFKPSGEKQCGQSVGLSIEDMGKQLSRKKVYIFESYSQPDGLMHITMCGAPTGKIHVFTILKKDLNKAQKAGFKTLNQHP